MTWWVESSVRLCRIVSRGTRADEIKARKKTSDLWHLIKKLHLQENHADSFEGAVQICGHCNAHIWCYTLSRGVLKYTWPTWSSISYIYPQSRSFSNASAKFQSAQVVQWDQVACESLIENVVEAILITDYAGSETVYKSGTPLISSEYPFESNMVQFPLDIRSVIIIKSQGQSLKTVGIDFTGDCFSHGQFYGTCLRVCSRSSRVVWASNDRTSNVVYKEGFYVWTAEINSLK